MSAPYLQQIDAMISAYRKEIERLEAARTVIVQLQNGEVRSPVLALKSEAPQVSDKIVIRKIAGPVKSKGKERRIKPAVDMPELTVRVTAALEAAPGGLRNVEVCDAIGMKTAADEKRIFYALSKLVNERKVTKSEGRYSLLHGAPGDGSE